MKVKVMLAIVSIMATLFCAEALVRIFRFAPGIIRLQIDERFGSFESSMNPILRYQLQPLSKGVNAYGIRDHDYTIRKAPGTYRIVVIGDSIAYGVCNDQGTLALDTIFAKVLERSLSSRKFIGIEKVEVINLGVSGYDTSQEVEMLREKGLRLSPDAVIVAYCLNDSTIASWESNIFDHQPVWGKMYRGVLRGFFLRSHLFRVLTCRMDVKKLYNDSEVEFNMRVGSSMERLRSFADKGRFRVMVVVFPFFADNKPYPHQIKHDNVAGLCKKVGFDHVDLLEPFLIASKGKLSELQGRCNREHPDERGHAVAARVIEEALVTSSYFVPTGSFE